jgi:phosphatidylglycerophosphatase GEP4
VGDRVFTDVVLAHRLAHPRTPVARIAARLGLRAPPVQTQAPRIDDDAGPASASANARVDAGRERTRTPLAVWTTGVWTRESTLMRWAEAWLVRLVERWVEGARERRGALEERFVRGALDSTEEVRVKRRGWCSWVKGPLPKLR